MKTTDISPSSEKLETKHSVYFEGPGRIDTPVYLLGSLDVGDRIHGPAIVLDSTQTLVLDPNSEAIVTRGHLYIELK